MKTTAMDLRSGQGALCRSKGVEASKNRVRIPYADENECTDGRSEVFVGLSPFFAKFIRSHKQSIF